MDEKHKRLRFSPQMKKIFLHLDPYIHENEAIKIINSSCWCFPICIVVPKEQHKLWIQITVPKACKTSVNEEKKDLL